MAKCKYCECGEDNTYLVDRKKSLGTLSAWLSCFIGSDEQVFIGTDFGANGSEAELIYTSKKINFCPMCGRKLRKGKTNG